MTVMVRHVRTRRTYVGGSSKSTFVFRRAWESIYILKTKLKTMLKPDLVNTNQSHWLLPSLFFTRAGNRHACPHLPMPLSAWEQQEQAALGGSRADQDRDLLHSTPSHSGQKKWLGKVWWRWPGSAQSPVMAGQDTTRGQDQPVGRPEAGLAAAWLRQGPDRELLGLQAEGTWAELDV